MARGISRAPKGVPRDEWLLANAIAAAKANHMQGCVGLAFSFNDETPHACCAIGGIAMAVEGVPTRGDILSGKYDAYKIARNAGLDDHAIVAGNDEVAWCKYRGNGESLGWAFRQAMDGAEG